MDLFYCIVDYIEVKYLYNYCNVNNITYELSKTRKVFDRVHDEIQLFKVLDLPFVWEYPWTLDKLNQALYDSVRENKQEYILPLLEHGADINIEWNGPDTSPLGLACKYGNIDMLKYLLTLGARVNTHHMYHYPPITMMCTYNPECKYKNSFDYNYWYHKDPVLKQQFETNRYAIMELLIRHGANVNTFRPRHKTPLFYAVYANNIQLVEFLLKHRASVSAIDGNLGETSGYTPLMYASKYGYVDIVKLLLQHGADIRYKTYYGYSPINVANKQVLEFFKQKGYIE